MNANIFTIAYLCAAVLVAERLKRNIKKSARRADFERNGTNIMHCAIFIMAALWPFFLSSTYLRAFKKFLSKKIGKGA